MWLAKHFLHKALNIVHFNDGPNVDSWLSCQIMQRLWQSQIKLSKKQLNKTSKVFIKHQRYLSSFPAYVSLIRMCPWSSVEKNIKHWSQYVEFSVVTTNMCWNQLFNCSMHKDTIDRVGFILLPHNWIVWASTELSHTGSMALNTNCLTWVVGPSTDLSHIQGFCGPQLICLTYKGVMALKLTCLTLRVVAPNWPVSHLGLYGPQLTCLTLRVVWPSTDLSDT